MLSKSTAFNFLPGAKIDSWTKLYWFRHAKLRSFSRRKLISRLINIFYRFEIRFACFYFRFIHISTLRRNIWPRNCIRTLVEVPQQEGWSLVTGTVSNCYRKSLSLSVLWAIVCRYDIPCFFKHFAAPTSFGVVLRPLLYSLGYHCFRLAPQQEYSVVVDAIKIEILNYIWLGLYWPPICINEANTL